MLRELSIADPLIFRPLRLEHRNGDSSSRTVCPSFGIGMTSFSQFVRSTTYALRTHHRTCSRITQLTLFEKQARTGKHSQYLYVRLFSARLRRKSGNVEMMPSNVLTSEQMEDLSHAPSSQIKMPLFPSAHCTTVQCKSYVSKVQSVVRREHDDAEPFF